MQLTLGGSRLRFENSKIFQYQNSKGEDCNSMKSTKNFIISALTLAALSVGLWAQTGTASKPASKKKHATAAAATSSQPAVTAAAGQSLNNANSAQHQQIKAPTQPMH